MAFAQTVRHPALYNDEIEMCIKEVEKQDSQDNIWNLLRAFQRRIAEHASLLIPVIAEPVSDLRTIPKLSLENPDEPCSHFIRKVELAKGGKAFCAFTSWRELDKGEGTDWETADMETILRQAYEDDDVMGLLINPWDVSVLLNKQLLEVILNPDEEVNPEPVAKSSIYLDKRPIASQEAEALVNAAVNPFAFDTQSGREILEAAGEELREFCPINRPPALFETIVTEARFDNGVSSCLNTDPFQTERFMHPESAPENESITESGWAEKKIIHLSLPERVDLSAASLRSEENTILKACTAIMDRAREENLHSIALAAGQLSQGSMQSEQTAGAIVLAIAAWINRSPDYRLDVTIVCDTQECFDSFYAYLFE